MATQVELIVNKSRALLGAYYIDSSGMTYCQKFVRHCYEAAGLYGSADSAAAAGDKWIVSKEKDNIPVGAAVYFTNGNTNGHVGIYIGNGKMRHVWSKGKVCETEISVASGYRGWGWHGGKEPTGADKTVSEGNNNNNGGKSVELCSTSVVSTVNNGSEVMKREFININSEGGKYELHIINRGIDYVPIVLDSVEWSTEWIDTAGKLSFSVLKDSNIDITEGNAVIFKADGVGVFYGYLFEKSKGADGKINCTAYDQLRYFKNKDTICYKDKKYSELLKMIADSYDLNCSENLTDTEYVISQRVEDNESLLDIIKNAREITFEATGNIYIVYDDFGWLNIKKLEELKTDYLLTDKTAEGFEYKTSIDSDVYNKIQLYKDDNSTGNREMYIFEDGDSINAWGILQKTEKLEEGADPNVNGPEILNSFNKKKKSFSVKGCLGDVRLRAGASIYVSLNVGDVIYDNTLFYITNASHSFGSSYTCDLTLVSRDELNAESEV